VALALVTHATVSIPAALRWALSVGALLPVPYLVGSVVRHLGWRRVAGLDHFDPSVRAGGLVRKGIFRWSPNALYVFGMPAIWVPGLALQSGPALVAAAFAHAYLWVHYACTERPDLRAMYGAAKIADR
jgi:protein-S-isoprenylcysteine O-methyltransferase Ste14